MAQAYKSTKPLKEAQINRKWILVDAKNQILGRVTNDIARLLQGKHKVDYVPYLDTGDIVVVVNAKKIVVTGRKNVTKEYTNYSGYPGGLRTVSYKTMMEEHPEEIIRHAVSGKLPKNKLRDRRMSRLYVFPDDKHSFEDKFKS